MAFHSSAEASTMVSFDRSETPLPPDTPTSEVAAGEPEFGRQVEAIARSVLEALPAADGVGLAVLEDGRLEYLAVTADFVAAVDQAQYARMQGPGVTAATERRTVLTPSLGVDPQWWSGLGQQVEHLGVHSALAIPLTVQDQLIGTINVYAFRTEAFDAADAARGEEYARTAAAALQQASVLRRARLLARRLGSAAERRRTINRTVGLLMAQDGVEAAEAMASLEATAHARSGDLGSAAQEIWDDRIGSARLAPSAEDAWAARR